jgi:hypothetical protein
MRNLAVVLVVGLAAMSVGQGTAARTTPLAAPRDVEIVGLDYAFQVPPTIAAGPTTFRFVNRGKSSHELNISLLKRGASVEKFMEAVRADKPTGEFRDGPLGVLFAEPAKRGAAGLTSNLLAGRTYVIVCIFRDSAKAKQHLAMGMVATFVPTGADVKALVAQRIDTIFANEYAFTYPRSLSPGRHMLAFVNQGKFRHEILLELLKKGVTLQQVLETDKAGGSVGALIDDGLGVLHSPAGTAPLGRLEVDLLPGREYTIVCTFSNDEKSPPHAQLGMFGSIRVSGTAR